MEFIETSFFTADICELLDDRAYREFQMVLAARPDAGAVIRGTSGARKIRWRLPGTGKSGGLRVIYYWDVRHDRIYLLLAYRKARQETLTPSQKATLGEMIRNELGKDLRHG